MQEKRLLRLIELTYKTYLASTGVTANVIGMRTGASAFVHRKAMASEEPLEVKAFANQLRSSGFASLRRSSSGPEHRFISTSGYAMPQTDAPTTPARND